MRFVNLLPNRALKRVSKKSCTDHLLIVRFSVWKRSFTTPMFFAPKVYITNFLAERINLAQFFSLF